MKIVYQGIPGSYSEACAQKNYPGVETIACKTFDECFEKAFKDNNVKDEEGGVLDKYRSLVTSASEGAVTTKK